MDNTLPQLPVTYYDVLVSRQLDEPLVKAVRRDVSVISGKGPYVSTDDFSQNFGQYIDYVKQNLGQDIQNQLLASGITSPAEVAHYVSSFFQSREFKQLLFSKHADYLSLTNFELFGRKIFYLNSNLIDQLAITDLEIDSQFLRLPFPSCLFVVSGSTDLRVSYKIYNKKDEEIDFKTPVSVFATEIKAEEGGRKIMFACWHANRRKSYSFIKRELLIRPGWKISDTLKTNWDEIHEEIGSNEISINEILFGEATDDEVLRKDGVAFFRIVLNAILYLGSNDVSVMQHLSPHTQLLERLMNTKSNAKRKKIKATAKKISKLDFTEVGAITKPIVVKKPSIASTSQSLSIAQA